MTKTKQIIRDYKRQKVKNISKLARKYNVSRGTIYSYLYDYGVIQPNSG